MKRLIYFLLMLFVFVASCNTQRKASKFRFDTPEAGTLVKKGESIPLKLVFPSEISSFDSIVYAIDGEILARKTDSTPVSLDTEKAPFGSRTLSAKLYHGGEEQIAYSNIVVVPPAPKRYGFKVVHEYPHDPEAYTQGLEFDHQGVLYESTGQQGKSSIRKVNYQTGDVLQKAELDAKYFGEGLTIVGDKIIQLTWREHRVGFVYNKSSFAKIGEFTYGQSPEGWGLCYDGKRLIKSDGSSKLYFLNKDTYAEEGFIEIYNDKGPMDSLNELEYIDGKIYANVYTKDFIVIINPDTGAIEGEINLIGIYPDKQEANNELNGIAYEREGKRLFITGKNWRTLYEIELVAR
ncbi:glutaminyl-peptide cyclotransferase [Parapedobacter indicus]|uniref:Glutamine cyclotransferase n=1 Tax=Parapedobacter indicus TaxID=1477437 RepID=A0A1I3JWK1_9SPHI|nr:glutaminyl-peptide cyclotransferase [Parapedobacter indicus]PPL01625.1 glutamine cyclotransferase [Parapedobacter indicus]SFI64325.1 Glutamine cyclotransferase [Parapedobacter indicus]